MNFTRHNFPFGGKLVFFRRELLCCHFVAIAYACSLTSFSIRADFDPVGVICITDSGAIAIGNEDHPVPFLDVNFRSKSQGILVILFFRSVFR